GCEAGVDGQHAISRGDRGFRGCDRDEDSLQGFGCRGDRALNGRLCIRVGWIKGRPYEEQVDSVLHPWTTLHWNSNSGWRYVKGYPAHGDREGWSICSDVRLGPAEPQQISYIGHCGHCRSSVVQGCRTEST